MKCYIYGSSISIGSKDGPQSVVGMFENTANFYRSMHNPHNVAIKTDGGRLDPAALTELPEQISQ